MAKAEVNARSMLVRSTHDGIDVIKSSLVLSIVAKTDDAVLLHVLAFSCFLVA